MSPRETLEVDILIVGGGPAGMSAALRLAQLQKDKGGEPLAIAVLEKAREVGAHMLSGAVLDPSALKDLIPDFQAKGAPLSTEVHRDDIYFLTRTSKVRLPITPPFFRNHGNYVISLSRFVKWLANLVEAEGIDIFTGFSATDVLFDSSAGSTRVVGVRTGDRGIDKHGRRKATFEPGGLHVMLVGLKQDLKTGDEIEITLHFKNYQDLPVRVPVQDTPASEHDH